MSALPRPSLLPGAHRELNDALHDLHRRASWPSLRQLARQAGCSHTTVSHAFSDARLPTWGLLELLVEAMDGDTDHFHRLWLAASGEGDGVVRAAGAARAAGTTGTTDPDRAAGATGATDPDPHLPPTIAGRRRELDVVRRHLEEGSGPLLLTGEAGIGKTRLLTAATGLTSERTFVAGGSCLPLATEVPLLPVTDLLRSVLRHGEGVWFKEALGECASFVTASLAHQLPELAPRVTVPDPDDEWSRQRLFTAVTTLLATLADLQPLALVVEDLQWADATTLDLLEHLVVRGTRYPIVLTMRDDPGTPPRALEWEARIRRSSVVVDLHLGPLDREETAEQLALLLGEAPTAATVDRIHRRTLGHPFFTEQLARHTRGGRGAMPRLLAELLDRQLDGLSAPGWQVAVLLAVADRPLPTGLLSDATGLDPDDVLAAIHELADRQLAGEPDSDRTRDPTRDLTRDPTGPVSADEVRLRHPLLAEAVRRRLVPGEESRAHRALAECLPHLPGTSAAEVAAHWQAVGDVGSELEWRIRAARQATSGFAGRVAADHWSRALEIWPAGAAALGAPPLTRPEVWNAVLDACDLAGDLERGDQAAQRALAESEGRPVDRAELLRRAGRYRAGLYDLGGAHQLLDQAIELYRQLPPSEGLVQALDLKCHVSNRQGHHQDARDLLEEARQVLDAVGDSPLRREVLASIAWQDSVTGDIERAAARMAEVARMVPVAPEPRRDLQVSVMHTDILLKASRPPEEVEAAAAPGILAIEEWGLENLRGNLLRANVALAWMRAGRLEQAAEVLVATAPDEGVRGEWGVHLVRARLDCALGQVGLARERCAHLLDRRPAAVDVLAPVMAELEFWDRTVDDAFDPLVRACAAMPNLLVPGEAGDSLVLAARGAAELASRSQPHGTPTGRRRMAGRLADLLELATHDPFAPDAVPVDRHAGPQWHAELARLVGTETVAVWQAAAEEWDAARRPHDAAYCRWRAAEVALRDGDREAADRLLRRATRDSREHEPLSAAIRATTREA